MKRIVTMLFSSVLATGLLLAQGWNSTVTTTISASLGSLSTFSNKDGIHIVYNNTSGTDRIDYVLLNSSGTVIRSSTISTSVNTGYPRITGDNSNVYLLYTDGQNVKTWVSTNAGTSWTSLNDVSMGSSNTSGIDASYDPLRGGLHMVYAISAGNGTTYYQLYSGSGWGNWKNVTDYSGEYGGNPTVAYSSNKVHVSYNKGGYPTTRDYNYQSSSWENPQLVSVLKSNLVLLS